MDRAIWWIEHIMRHPFMYEGKSPVHKLYWFQYFLLDVLALYLLILYAVFKIVKFIVCKLCFTSSPKPKNDWAYIWKRLCDFLIDDISLSKSSIKLLESIHCMIISLIIFVNFEDIFFSPQTLLETTNYLHVKFCILRPTSV